MSTNTPDRILELWPSLSDEARERLVEIAESIAGADVPLVLSSAEEQLLKQAREDFRHGRTQSLDDFKADLDVLFAELRCRTGAA